MKLLEREDYLNTLNRLFRNISDNSGQTLFITGEAGIGKTSLVKTFIKQVENSARILTGACDSLFTPRPLGPLFDISVHLHPEFQRLLRSKANRSELFSEFIKELRETTTTVLVFEDIHWADEATIDLIKYLSRRIDQVNCLFILTYRDDEILPDHPVRTIHGEIPPHSLTKLRIGRLSLAAVQELSKNTGLNAEQVYELTDGNPFYVTEILASYSPGIPDNIKDSILSVFFKQSGKVRELWELISILPGRIDHKLLELIQPDFKTALETCIQSGILRMEDNYLLFKHELYRKTIEEALTSYHRIRLNGKVLEVLLSNKEVVSDLTFIVHHAKNALNSPVVAEYAPIAAKNAAMHGAHIEAAKLFLTAVQNTRTAGKPLAELYEMHAYECYLTNQIKNAIESQLHALDIWKQLEERIKIGSSMRFLSRLHWFEGNRVKAEEFGLNAISELEKGFHLEERAKAYSNYAQLKMLSNEKETALEYGQKAVDLALQISDEEILSHALNNIGSVIFQTEGKMTDHLNQSLEIALRRGFHEHAARAYTNIGSIAVEFKLYDQAASALQDGISYCRQRDLDSWTYYMLSWKSRLHFERCEWKDAELIARNIIEYPAHPPVVRIGSLTILGRLLLRKGDFSGLSFLQEAKELAIMTRELQRIVPVAIALLEYGWIINNPDMGRPVADAAFDLLRETFVDHYYSELAYWMYKNNLHCDFSKVKEDPYKSGISGNWEKAAGQWQQLGCKYEYALALFEGTEESQREALVLLDQLGATGTLESLKSKLRARGSRKIPRGPRLSTKSNLASLTQRQIDVLNLLKEGMQNTMIADRLFISAKTVDHHVTAILSKLNVHSRTMAIKEAEKLGIL